MMLHFIVILFFIAPFVYAGRWLLNHPGEINVAWLGYDVSIHTAIAAFALLLLVVLVVFFTALFWQLITWPERRRERKRYKTLSRGLNQLTLGVTALAMGDEDAAQNALQKALLALPNEPLPQLLTAQLLQRQGKHEDARLQLRALMKHPLTASLATRRLIEQHVADREYLEATRLAEEARADAPKEGWLVMTLLDLYAREKNTIAMLALTEGWQFQSPLSREERHHHAALAHYIHAASHENTRVKAQHLRHAVGYAPAFLPAIIDYAALLQSEGELRKARKLLLGAWQMQPRLLLIAPVLATMEAEPDRTQLRLLKPFLRGELTAVQHLLAARQAMEVRDFARAKALLEAALAIEENKTACSWMAEVEKELRGSDSANGWLARAMEAPPGMGWVCSNCGSMAAHWHSHCSSCGHYDSARYERPEARITSVELMV